MPFKIRRAWLGWGLYVTLLVGLGVALYLSLPPQPRFVLTEGIVDHLAPGMLSPDGAILTAGAILDDDSGRSNCGSIKSWDTRSGELRGEFFHGLNGVWPGRTREEDHECERGFYMNQVSFSPERRFCALLHRGGMAVADLRTGREWPLALECKLGEDPVPESLATCELLQQAIPTAGMSEKIKFSMVLQLFSQAFGEKARIVVDRDAFAAEAEKDAPDLDDEEVSLPPVPRTVVANTALRRILGQVGRGNARYIVRRGQIVITTASRIRSKEVGQPVFSPQGSFVAVVVEEMGKSELHLVECASGKHIVSLTLPRHGLSADFGFTSDEDLLFFFADKDPRPLLTIWDTRRKQIARTLPEVVVQSLQRRSPDGTTLLISTPSAGQELLDLRTGKRRPLPDSMRDCSWGTFSSDGKTVFARMPDGLRCWDVSTGKQKSRLKIDFPLHGWFNLFVSADSRVVCAIPWQPEDGFIAWSLQTGDRLWPPREDSPVVPDDSRVPMVWDWHGEIDPTPRFTPDLRFLVDRKNDRIDLIDPASGELHRSITLDGTATLFRLIGFTPDGRSMLSQWNQPAPLPGSIEEWLSKILPIFEARSCLIVSAVDTGRVLLSVKDDGEGRMQGVLSDGGRTLLTSNSDGETTDLACWDVPGRPSLFLVVGIPLALGCVGVALRWFVARRRRMQQEFMKRT
jgi:hypothetical protein